MLQNSRTVKKYIIDPDELSKEAQVGVDLTVKGISWLSHGPRIPKEGKTEHASFMPMNVIKGGWMLLAGKAYSCTFDQGLKQLPRTLTAFIIHRSSLNRNGCIVTGSVFDPGYSCKNLGATIYPTIDIFIEEHARIAQIILEENMSVTNMYDGQYSKE